MVSQFQRVVVGVCTCQRPIMLRACLDSLAAQVVPADVEMQIVVVDNESQPNNRGGVEAFAASCPVPVHYVHQPKRGIAAARNAILDRAMELGAGWIAMIDDDETADPMWVANLMREEQRRFPVLSGQRRYTYSGQLPFWASERRQRTVREPQSASTCNIRFSRALVDAGLRFDENLGLAGGEDSRFFRRAVAAGFQIGCADDAITWEVRHPERMGYHAIMAKVFAQNVGSQRQKIMDCGRFRVCGKTLPKAVLELAVGTAILSASPFGLLAGPQGFRALALRGGKQVAKGLASFSAAAGYHPQPYRHIVGH